jgi:hypothetical protein
VFLLNDFFCCFGCYLNYNFDLRMEASPPDSPSQASPGGTRRPLPNVPVVRNKLLGKPLKARSNTTSSVFAKNTPSKPDVLELISCITLELTDRISEVLSLTTTCESLKKTNKKSAKSKYENGDDMFDERLYDARASCEQPAEDVLRAFVTKGTGKNTIVERVWS